MKTQTAKFLQQRKFYMALPLLILPFVTLAFWALGGGQPLPVMVNDKNAGLNLDLPDAHFEKNDQQWDKFTLYEQAKKDSLKAEETKRNDPYYVVSTLDSFAANDTITTAKEKLNTTLSRSKNYSAIDNDADQINHKIDQLTFQLNQPVQTQPVTMDIESNHRGSGKTDGLSPDIDRLEKLMESMSNGNTEDPEMQQMDGLLEKILDVQHPERVKEKIREQSIHNKSQVLPVTSAASDNPITIITGTNAKSTRDSTLRTGMEIQTQNAFFGLNGESSEVEQNVNTIDAIIHETQTVVAGSIIKMRLLSPVFIQGEWLDKDQFVYGVCAINGERLTVTVQSIRDEHALYPVALSVYDLDGIEGIYIPGAISRDAAKQATSQSIQDVQLYSMNNSLGVQAAAAGMEAAKGLFSKKAKLIKVTIKAGYQVLLKDTNQKASN